MPAQPLGNHRGCRYRLDAQAESPCYQGFDHSEKGRHMETPFVLEHHTLGAMPYLTVRPRLGGPYPAIIALHGFTGDKETMLPLAVPLALANFVVACPDARYHGARRDEAWARRMEEAQEIGVYQSATETAEELPALVDALLARPDVRPSDD